MTLTSQVRGPGSAGLVALRPGPVMGATRRVFVGGREDGDFFFSRKPGTPQAPTRFSAQLCADNQKRDARRVSSVAAQGRHRALQSASTPLVASDFPAAHRAGVGSRGLRIGIFRIRDSSSRSVAAILKPLKIAVKTGNLWSARTARVTLMARPRQGRCGVEKKGLSKPLQQDIPRRGRVQRCFSLEPGAPSLLLAQGDARSYELKR